MSYGYIYKTTNLINKRFYIGQCKGTFRQSYLGSGIAIRRAVKQYNRDSFIVECLVEANSKFDLDWLERHLIAEYREIGFRQQLYNISSGGTGGRDKGIIPWNKGKTGLWKHSTETRRLLSEKLKGRPVTERQRLARSVAHKGRPKSEEHKQHMREHHADFRNHNHPQWNPLAPNHKGNIYYCKCGKTITRHSARCKRCANSGSNNPRFNSTKKRSDYCVDCGVVVGPTSRWCIVCRNKHLSRRRWGYEQ